MPGVLACPACRTRQLARQRDPLCQDCTHAAQEVVSRPLWLFDSPLLRQVLAQLNLSAVSAVVRAACGLSQRDLAGVVGWTPDALGSYERGLRDGVFDIRMLLQFADAVGMPRAVLLPLVLADPDASLTEGSGGNGPGMDIDRRGSGGLAAGAAILPGSASPLVSSSHIRYWRACTDALYVRDRVVGGTAMLQPALHQWQHVRQALATSADGDTGRQFLVIAGDLALCAGWIALDGGHLPQARSLYGEARQLAAGAGDTLLAVHALTSLSMLEAEMARTGPRAGSRPGKRCCWPTRRQKRAAICRCPACMR